MRHLFPPRVEHLQALFLPCLIAYFQRHMACLASLLVSCPVLGQRQAEVKQGMVVARDVAHEEAFHVWRDELASIAYSEGRVFSVAASPLSTDRPPGIVGQEHCCV